MSHISSRRFDLDWLRIAAFGLLILYHCGMLFVPWGFHIKLARLEWLEPLMHLTNPWRLSLLFLISGIASAAMLAKDQQKGHWGFLGERSRRLLLPLIFGVAVVVPPQSWVEVQANGLWTGNYIQFWRAEYFAFDAHLGPILPTWNHLWFVVYLWVYTLLLALALQLPAAMRTVAARGTGWALAGSRLLWVPMAGFAVITVTMTDAWPETHDLVHDLRAHLVYGSVFAIGLALGPAGPMWAAVARWWRLGLALGLAGWLAAELVLGQAGDPEGLWLVAVRIARAVQAWGMIIGLLGAGRHWLAFDHRWRQPLAQAVFPAYLIHQTLLILIAWWVRDLPLPAQAGLVLAGTAVGTAAFCWITARIVWLRPWVGYSPLMPKAMPAPLRA
jgi:glucans biosynthesis protein C